MELLLPNYCDYDLKIVEKAGIILEYIRRWLLTLSITVKLTGHFKICLEEYKNQAE